MFIIEQSYKHWQIRDQFQPQFLLAWQLNMPPYLPLSMKYLLAHSRVNNLAYLSF